MLAQNFKTPADLRLTDLEFEALVKVLGMLERGELKHGDFKRREPGDWFNMKSYGLTDKCGTIGCIAGWARVVSNGVAFPWAESDTANPLYNFTAKKNLRTLFIPSLMASCWDKITPAQAAIALRNYLTHGEARWAEALAE